MTGSILNTDIRLYEKLKGWRRIDNMTKQEQLKELESRLFAINMQDYYELGDYALERDIKQKIAKLKEEIKNESKL